ncbi:MAG: AAA family ATPase [Sporomusaceae bacterium]|nr:AAA family ATPase [Sporomusaceae bacterium]
MAGMTGLPPERLRYHCDLCHFDFTTTETVPPLEVMIGQERAVQAVEFGLLAKNPGYNLYLSGLVGTGKITYADRAVRQAAAKEAAPDDWCYVNDFENPSQPIAFSLPAGLGSTLRRDLEILVEELKTDIPKAFSGDDYEQAKNAILGKLQEQRAQTLEAFNQRAIQLDIMPQWSTTGFVGIPMREGKQLTPDEFQKLEPQDREEIEKKLLAVHEKALESIRFVQGVERQAREQLKELDSKIALFTVGYIIDDLLAKYREHEAVVEYLEAVKKDVVKNIHDFKPEADEETNPLLLLQRGAKEPAKNKYKINLLVDNRDTRGAPVIVESNPTYYNLVGRVEYETRMGMVSTDFSMIKAGALHRANGGYLILHARDVLANLGSWDGLKRALKTRKLLLENLGEHYGMLALASLKPAAIPIQVKVILIGNPYLYNLLLTYDEDFRKLFKVYADFDVEMDNNQLNNRKLAGFISSTVNRESLRHFDRAAVGEVVTYASRLAGSQKKLTTRFSEVVELLCEADVWAGLDNSPLIGDRHVRQAIAQKRYRSNKYEEKLQELFADGTLLIDTGGAKVGQVNGLAVLSVGEYMFGKPSRITANTFIGKSGIVNIERETKTSGPSHSKGVLILGGYLGAKYAQEFPLAVTVSLTFEQMYDGVDGDSASSTELYAILSSLSGLPLRQAVAVTGSVNQKGEIQPIGGVTEKIEGYFAVCKLKGLSGEQGVMIPHQNIDHLNLSDEVIDAVRDGKFQIYAVQTIDEGIEILTGVAAARVHELVSHKLKTYTETVLRLSRKAEGEDSVTKP